MDKAIYDQAKLELTVIRRFRRLMPLLWLLVGLEILGGVIKVLRAEQIATVSHLGASGAWELVKMRHSEQLRRSFSGYEVVFVSCVNSAVFYFLSALVASALVLIARQGGVRRQSVISAYVEELERSGRMS